MISGYILGISCGYHDSAASLIKGGRVLGACEEERFTGIKHDSSFPINTINWLVSEFKITPNDLEAVCFYENPKLKLDRIMYRNRFNKCTNFVYFVKNGNITNNDAVIKTVSISQARKPVYKSSIKLSDNYLNYLDFLKKL